MRRYLSLLLFVSLLGLPVNSEPLGQSDGFLGAYKSAAQSVYKTPKGDPYRVYHLEFASDAAAKKYSGGENTIFNRWGRFVDIFAPPGEKAIEELTKLSDLVWVDYNRVIRVPVPPGEPEHAGPTRAGAEKVIAGGIDEYKGKGVTIAVIDSGFDIRHPDFQLVTPDGKRVSRFRALWDTTETRNDRGKPAPISYPDGRSIGVIYTREHLNEYLQTEPAQRPDIVWDRNGHGTACAGIAAGNGQSTEGRDYVGVAPEADLIGVRLGDNAQNTWLITAILTWLDEEVGDKPLVISNSWGGHGSGHDGNFLIERQIDARFPENRPGRLVLFAAGNEGNDPLHVGLDFEGKDKAATLMMPKVGAEDKIQLTFYFDSDDGTINTEPGPSSAYLHKLSKQWVAEFSPEPGQESMTIWSESGKKGHVDVYIAGQIGEESAKFPESAATYETLVNSPGNAANVLTVGSYDFNPFFHSKGKQFTLGTGKTNLPMTVGDISAYSSPGFTRLGRLKPDLTAPGQWWTAAAPADVELIRDSSKKYQLFNGTSAATPYTAGVMAIFLQKKPDLTLAQVRKLLDKHLQEDLYTGPLPNPEWGRGKLEMEAILGIFDEL